MIIYRKKFQNRESILFQNNNQKDAKRKRRKGGEDQEKNRGQRNENRDTIIKNKVRHIITITICTFYSSSLKKLWQFNLKKTNKRIKFEKKQDEFMKKPAAG